VTDLEPPAPRVDPHALDLLLAQLRALQSWHDEHRSARQRPAETRREAQLDAVRERDTRAREVDALLRRSERALEESRALLASVAPRALLAHRQAWFLDRVRVRLVERGAEVVAPLFDGAEAVGVAVLEQPDLVLVSDLLPGWTGAQAVERVRRFVPSARIGATASSREAELVLTRAGADVVWQRDVPPAVVADGLLDLLGA
jgi:CheY-like chemotaxis protein